MCDRVAPGFVLTKKWGCRFVLVFAGLGRLRGGLSLQRARLRDCGRRGERAEEDFLNVQHCETFCDMGLGERGEEIG